MHPLKAVSVYFAFVFLAGALIAPWVYFLVQQLAAYLPLQAIASEPFHRYVNRSLLVLGLVGLWPFLRSQGVKSLAAAGLPRDRQFARSVLAGFAMGFGSLAIIAGISFLAGARFLDAERSVAQIFRHLLNAALAAVVVGVMEEVFFRGALLGSLRKRSSFTSAVLLSSGLYALLHFFARPPNPPEVHWWSGLWVLGQMLQGFAAIDQLIPAFVNLMLAGIILGCGYERTGALFYSIGLHAGWIFWLKSYGFVTEARRGYSPGFWGSDKLIDGWLAFFILLLLAAGHLYWARQSPLKSTT